MTKPALDINHEKKNIGFNRPENPTFEACMEGMMIAHITTKHDEEDGLQNHFMVTGLRFGNNHEREIIRKDLLICFTAIADEPVVVKFGDEIE